MPYWQDDGMYGNWAWGLFMLIAMVLFWGGLITVVVVLLRQGRRFVSSHDNAKRILDERFARGEIDQEEYDQRRAALKS